MRHLYNNLILVVLSYSLALSTPVVAQSTDNYTEIKNYVNGSGKKSFKGLVQKMDKGIPANFYEETLKKVKSPEGAQWFDAAKLATNYSYFRLGNSKVFIRTAQEKGQTVFYANGMKIVEDDFRNIRRVENILYMAFVAGYAAPKKTSFLNLFSIYDVSANPVDAPAEVATPTVAVAPVAQPNDCERIGQEYRQFHQAGDMANARAALTEGQEKNCPISPLVATNTAATGGMTNQAKIALAIFALIFILMLMKSRKKKKAPAEVPEDEDGVGRGGDSPTDPGGSGGVPCGGEGAQCGGTTNPGTPNPGQPTPPPTGESTTPVGRDDTSYDPNQYAIPMSKTRRSK